MKRRIELHGEYKESYEKVLNAPFYFIKKAIPAHKSLTLQDYDRYLLVTGFSFPDVSHEADTNLVVTIKQILVDQKTGLTVDVLASDNFHMSSTHKTGLRVLNNFTQNVLLDETHLDENDVVIDTIKTTVDVPTAKMYKQALQDGTKSLSDILNDVLRIYIEERAEKLY